MQEFALRCIQVQKSFNEIEAVRSLSLDVLRGEIFGLLGPNGAGKTTLIRMIMDIIRPDTGNIEILGRPIVMETKERTGYLPEERGLYQKIRVNDLLMYIGRLKGLHRAKARHQSQAVLERLGLVEVARRKIRELSRGNQQKVQMAATIVHEPSLIILDEPFTGLDPVNRELVREIVREQSDKGTTVILSTHLMDQVEELCDRVVLMHQGSIVLGGTVASVRESRAEAAYIVAPPADFDKLDCVATTEPIRQRGSAALKVRLKDGMGPDDLLKSALEAGFRLDRFERALPSLEEVFIQTVEGNGTP